MIGVVEEQLYFSLFAAFRPFLGTYFLQIITEASLLGEGCG